MGSPVQVKGRGENPDMMSSGVDINTIFDKTDYLLKPPNIYRQV
jgi:hypothetical protein